MTRNCASSLRVHLRHRCASLPALFALLPVLLCGACERSTKKTTTAEDGAAAAKGGGTTRPSTAPVAATRQSAGAGAPGTDNRPTTVHGPGGEPVGWAVKRGVEPPIEVIGGGDGNIIALGSGAATRPSGGGDAGAVGRDDTERGGPLAMFGAPGGGAIGPKGAVFGDGGNARKIVFVCDASGGMITKIGSLRAELNKTVGALMPIQSFNVIFFQEDAALPFNKAGLVVATFEAKRNLAKFLEGVTTSGRSDPLAALRTAFEQKPQLIYLLTDGSFPDNDAVLKSLRELNNEKKVRINTIAFANERDADEDFVKLMKAIAAENGGTFRHVLEEKLDP